MSYDSSSFLKFSERARRQKIDLSINLLEIDYELSYWGLSYSAMVVIIIPQGTVRSVLIGNIASNNFNNVYHCPLWITFYREVVGDYKHQYFGVIKLGPCTSLGYTDLFANSKIGPLWLSAWRFRVFLAARHGLDIRQTLSHRKELSW